jgi:hypothetical protein
VTLVITVAIDSSKARAAILKLIRTAQVPLSQDPMILLMLLPFKFSYQLEENRQRVVQPKNRVSISGRGRRFFSLPHRQDPPRSPTSLLLFGYRRLFPWSIKCQGHEFSHLPPPNVEYTNDLHYASQSSHKINGAHKVIFTFLDVFLLHITSFAIETQPPLRISSICH